MGHFHDFFWQFFNITLVLETAYFTSKPILLTQNIDEKKKEMRKIKKKWGKDPKKWGKKWGNTGENEEILLKMRKSGRKKWGKLGTFFFLKLRSGDIFYFCVFFATLPKCDVSSMLNNCISSNKAQWNNLKQIQQVHHVCQIHKTRLIYQWDDNTLSLLPCDTSMCGTAVVLTLIVSR